MKKLIPIVLMLLIAAALLPLQSAVADDAKTAEYNVKAVHIFNFTKFIEWPTNAFASDSAPLTIGVLGDDPFGGALEQVVKDEKTHGRNIEVVKSSRNVDDLKQCHIVFVSRTEQAKLQKIAAGFAGVPALVVGDSQGFAEHGGIINFYQQGTKLRFEINAREAQKRGLKIGAQLLGVAKIVEKAE